MNRKYILVYAASAAAAGIWAGAQLGSPLVPLGAGGLFCLALSLVLLFIGKRNAGIAAGLLAVFLAGALRMGIADRAADDVTSLEGAAGVYSAVIAEEAQETEAYTRYLIALQSIRYENGSEHAARGLAYLHVPKDLPELSPDTKVRVAGDMSRIRLYKNPGKIDLESRYRSRGIVGRIYTERKEQVTALGRAGEYSLAAFAYEVKEGIRARFEPYMDAGRLSLLMTLLFGGSYEALPEGVLPSFTATGLVHILSVSGSHIALLLGFLCLIGKWLRLPLRAVLPAAVCAILCYAALAGFAAPVVRASVMGILSAAALFFRRESEGILTLSAAVLLMLFWEPFYLFDVSFELSALASAGILLFYRPLLAALRRLHFPRWAAEGTALAFSAQALTVPIVLYDFHILPVYFVPANLLVAPLLEGSIILGLAAALLSCIFLPLAGGILQLADYALLLAMEMNFALSSLPHAVFAAGALAAAETALWYALLAAWLLRARFEKKEMRCASAVVLGVILLWNGWSFWNRPEAECIVPDLGAARAAAFRTEGKTILYYKDSGLAFDIGGRELLSALGYKGIFRADVFIGDFRRCKEPSPFTLAIPIREIWLTEEGHAAAKNFLAAHPESRVRVVKKFRAKLSGGIETAADGASWEIRMKDTSFYIDGGTALSVKPAARRMWLGGAESFTSAVNGDTMKLLAASGAVYAGNRSQGAGEDTDLFRLLGIPFADTYREGMAVLSLRRGAWEMETYAGETIPLTKESTE